MSCSKVHDTLRSGGISSNAALVALENDKKTTSRIPDVAQHHKESNAVKQPSVEENVADKQGGDGHDTNDERHDHHGKAAGIVGDEKEVEAASEKTQVSAVGDNAHGETLAPPNNEKKEVETPEDGSKRSIPVGNDLEPNPVDIKDTAHMNDDKSDGSQSSKGGTSGTVEPNKTTQDTAEKPNDGLNSAGRAYSGVECVTVIFHALLTPTMNIKQGDKVFLRGGPPFAWRASGKQLEMHVVRYISSQNKDV